VSEVTIKIPWKLIFGLGPNIVHRTPTSVDSFTAEICKGITPAPLIEGMENLPDNPVFVLAANHYQRKGLWILFPAAVMTQIIRQRYGPGDPPIRWMVTANWPRIKMGPLSFPSPGDILLPRVADALACYPVSFAGSNQAFTARSIRKILRDAPKANRPLGIFPEGVGGSAGVFSNPIPGVDRLLTHLAKSGMPVVPVCISEAGGRLIFRIGRPIPTAALLNAPNAAHLVLARIQGLVK
jgi:1-acyl-sn-glycerol-3-phosphate acyltransferase